MSDGLFHYYLIPPEFPYAALIDSKTQQIRTSYIKANPYAALKYLLLEHLVQEKYAGLPCYGKARMQRLPPYDTRTPFYFPPIQLSVSAYKALLYRQALLTTRVRRSSAKLVHRQTTAPPPYAASTDIILNNLKVNGTRLQIVNLLVIALEQDSQTMDTLDKDELRMFTEAPFPMTAEANHKQQTINSNRVQSKKQ